MIRFSPAQRQMLWTMLSRPLVYVEEPGANSHTMVSLEKRGLVRFLPVKRQWQLTAKGRDVAKDWFEPTERKGAPWKP